MKNNNSTSIKQKIVKITLFFFMTSLAVLNVVISLTFINRLTMPYNSEGNYFDEKSCNVYHQQSIFVYGLLSAILITLTIILAFKIIKKYKT